MASKRCLPTRFFKDPDIMNLESRDTQLILVGLVLMADDEGRELAHAKLLSRELDYPPEQIEAALCDLAANDLIVLYQAGRHRYYSLTRWGQWQSLSAAKITPSKCPAPPSKVERQQADETQESLETVSQNSPEFPREILGNSADSRKFPPQVNIIESNSIQSNSGEGEERELPPNVVTFPTDRKDGTTTTSIDEKSSSDHTRRDDEPTTQEVASILRLPTSDALVRIVQDYQHDPLLRLLGEADAAREYIDDVRRNRHGQQMSPAFFRRWLRREHEDAKHRQAPRLATAVTGTEGNAARAAPPTAATRPVLPRSLMHLADQVEFGHTPKPVKGGGER